MSYQFSKKPARKSQPKSPSPKPGPHQDEVTLTEALIAFEDKLDNLTETINDGVKDIVDALHGIAEALEPEEDDDVVEGEVVDDGENEDKDEDEDDDEEKEEK